MTFEEHPLTKAPPEAQGLYGTVYSNDEFVVTLDNTDGHIGLIISYEDGVIYACEHLAKPVVQIP